VPATAGVAVTEGPDAALPAGPEKTARVRAMFDTIAPRYQLVNHVISGGLDRRWRRRTLKALAAPPGALVLDLACGTGDFTRAARAAGHRVVGVDLSFGMLAADRSAGARAQADAAHLPLADGAVDALVCGYALRNFTDLAACLREAARVLRPGGRAAFLEVAQPDPGVLRAGYRVWFEHAVPAIGGLLSDREAYRYLPRSTAYLPTPFELRRLFDAAGFRTVGHRMLQGGLSQLWTATRAGMPSPAVGAP
jgi:demethylmenaquinone methyltransferase/2-methoxy-6-polyprenyl-1,4-benzoquinol methylase